MEERKEPNIEKPTSTITSESSQTLIEPEVKHELSKVAVNPKKSLFLVISLITIFGSLTYKLFFSSNEIPQPTKEATQLKLGDISKPTQDQNEDSTIVPKLPDVPKLETPTISNNLPPAIKNTIQASVPIEKTPSIPQEPPKPIELAPPPPPKEQQTNSNDAISKRKEAKIKSGIMLITGSNTQTSNDDTIISSTVKVKKKGDLDYVLNRGKIIHATIESAVNSDLEGEVRAIVSKDVYSESNKNILIPKGSRIFGAYSAGYKAPYGRIDISWNRIDLSSGYIIELEGKSVDSLGKAGTQGRLDMKYKEKIANSIFVSAFNIGFAKGLDYIIPPVSTAANTTKDTNSVALITSTVTSYLSKISNTSTPQEITTTITQLCANLKSGIVDTTSASYTSVDQLCKDAINPTSATDPSTRWSALTTGLLGVGSKIATNAVAQAQQTKEQQAAEGAYQQIGDTMKEAITKTDFAPTVTLDQGTKIEIYVKSDFLIPRETIRGLKFIK